MKLNEINQTINYHFFVPFLVKNTRNLRDGVGLVVDSLSDSPCHGHRALQEQNRENADPLSRAMTDRAAANASANTRARAPKHVVRVGDCVTIGPKHRVGAQNTR